MNKKRVSLLSGAQNKPAHSCSKCYKRSHPVGLAGVFQLVRFKYIMLIKTKQNRINKCIVHTHNAPITDTDQDGYCTTDGTYRT